MCTNRCHVLGNKIPLCYIQFHIVRFDSPRFFPKLLLYLKLFMVFRQSRRNRCQLVRPRYAGIKRFFFDRRAIPWAIFSNCLRNPLSDFRFASKDFGDKKRLKQTMLKALIIQCLGRESNPHSHEDRGILSPLRLPIPPPRHENV